MNGLSGIIKSRRLHGRVQLLHFVARPAPQGAFQQSQVLQLSAAAAPAKPLLEVAPERAPLVLEVEKDVVVPELAKREAQSSKPYSIDRCRGSIAKDLDAVPPGGMMVSRGAEVQHQIEAPGLAGDQAVGGARRPLVGVIDHDERVRGEMRNRQAQPIVLLLERMPAVVEVRADTGWTPRRLAHELPKIHVEEPYLPGRGVLIQRRAQGIGGAVKLREIVAGEDALLRISPCRAHKARAPVTSDLDINLARLQRGHRKVEEH